MGIVWNGSRSIRRYKNIHWPISVHFRAKIVNRINNNNLVVHNFDILPWKVNYVEIHIKYCNNANYYNLLQQFLFMTRTSYFGQDSPQAFIFMSSIMTDLQPGQEMSNLNVKRSLEKTPIMFSSNTVWDQSQLFLTSTCKKWINTIVNFKFSGELLTGGFCGDWWIRYLM